MGSVWTGIKNKIINIKYLRALPWLFLVLSFILFYQYHIRSAMTAFWMMILTFGTEAVVDLCRKGEDEIQEKELFQRILIYVPVTLFYVQAVFSQKTLKNHYGLMIAEGIVLLLLGIKNGKAIKKIWKMNILHRPDFGKNNLYLWGLALLFIMTICVQACWMYRWDSLDYCNQVNTMLQAFDFTFSNLGVISSGHLSAGFVIVYEFGLLLFGSNPNNLIYMNAILGILVEAALYFIFSETFPGKSKKRLVLATAYVFVMPLFFGLNGCISTDYIMTCFFIYFLYAHIKDLPILEIICGCILVLTKETAVVLLCAFCLSYLFIEVPRRKLVERKSLIKKELINVLPVFLWILLMLTVEKTAFMDVTQMLNWKGIILAAVVLLIVGLVVYACYKQKIKIHIPVAGLICCFIILAGVIVAVFGRVGEAQYKTIENLNSVGYAGRDYLLIRLKNIFLLDFQWLYWLFIVGLFLYILRKGKKPYKSSYIYAIIMTVAAFALAHCVYVTYAHPRYFQPVVLLVGFAGALLALSCKRKKVYQVMFAIFLLSLAQNFLEIDRLSKAAYSGVVTGEKEMISTSFFRKEATYTDAIAYNFEYTYLSSILREFVNDVKPTESTLFLIPDVTYPYMKSDRSLYVVWGIPWYIDDVEHIYYGDGKLRNYAEDGDIELKVQAVNSDQGLDLSTYGRVFYIDVPAVTSNEDTRVWMAKNYELVRFQTYKKASWKIDTYLVIP